MLPNSSKHIVLVWINIHIAWHTFSTIMINISRFMPLKHQFVPRICFYCRCDGLFIDDLMFIFFDLFVSSYSIVPRISIVNLISICKYIFHAQWIHFKNKRSVIIQRFQSTKRSIDNMNWKEEIILSFLIILQVHFVCIGTFSYISYYHITQKPFDNLILIITHKKQTLNL